MKCVRIFILLAVWAGLALATQGAAGGEAAAAEDSAGEASSAVEAPQAMESSDTCAQLLSVFDLNEKRIKAYAATDEAAQDKYWDLIQSPQKKWIQVAMDSVLVQAFPSLKLRDYHVEEHEWLWPALQPWLNGGYMLVGGVGMLTTALVVDDAIYSPAWYASIATLATGSMIGLMPNDVDNRLHRFQVRSEVLDPKGRRATLKCLLYVANTPEGGFDARAELRLPFELRGCRLKFEASFQRPDPNDKKLIQTLSTRERRHLEKSKDRFGGVRGVRSVVGRGELVLKKLSDDYVQLSHTLYSQRYPMGVEVLGEMFKQDDALKQDMDAD